MLIEKLKKAQTCTFHDNATLMHRVHCVVEQTSASQKKMIDLETLF